MGLPLGPPSPPQAANSDEVAARVIQDRARRRNAKGRYYVMVLIVAASGRFRIGRDGPRRRRRRTTSRLVHGPYAVRLLRSCP